MLVSTKKTFRPIIKFFAFGWPTSGESPVEGTFEHFQESLARTLVLERFLHALAHDVVEVLLHRDATFCGIHPQKLTGLRVELNVEMTHVSSSLELTMR